MIEARDPRWSVRDFPFTEAEVSEALEELKVPRENAEALIEHLKGFRGSEVAGVQVSPELLEFLGRSNRLRDKVQMYRASIVEEKRRREELRKDPEGEGTP